jgi:PIN domain nuclease of toxin-antitoxin system
LNGPLIADACALIAFHGETRRLLSAAGLAAMQGGAIAVSAVTVWELTRKISLGKLAPMREQNRANCVGFLRARGYHLLDLTPELAERANALPPHHADPLDRLLIATALERGLTVVTSDRWFGVYGVPTLW